jgi:hypothetical protein
MLTKIQAPAVRTFLPKCGYNRNMPRVAVFDPQEYAGTGFRHFTVEQGAGQIGEPTAKLAPYYALHSHRTKTWQASAGQSYKM